MKNELRLPKLIEIYVRGINAHDAAALQSSFAPNTVVKDVGQEFRGITEIKE